MRSLYKFMHKTKKQKGRGPKRKPETKKETTNEHKSKSCETPEERRKTKNIF